MNFKEMVKIVSSETELPADDVRKVGIAMLEKFADLINSQANFVSPVISFTSVTAPAKPAAGGKPAETERKFARMSIRGK